MRAPSPVLMMPREIMIDTPISQISELEKLLRASFMAPAAFSLVTPVTATSAMAMMDSAPMGSALPMMAAMVPTNSASKCQALGVTPSGTGMMKPMTSHRANAIAVGKGLKPIHANLEKYEMRKSKSYKRSLKKK